MEIEELKDVLLWAKKWQFELRDCLKHWGDDTESERLGWLLHYLENHKDKVAEALVTFEEQANLGALNTWCVEYIDKQPTLLREAIAAPAIELSQMEIMQNIVQQDEQILALYRHLESRLPGGHTQQLMSDLAEMEHHESMQMVKNQQLQEDI